MEEETFEIIITATDGNSSYEYELERTRTDSVKETKEKIAQMMDVYRERLSEKVFEYEDIELNLRVFLLTKYNIPILREHDYIKTSVASKTTGWIRWSSL